MLARDFAVVLSVIYVQEVSLALKAPITTATDDIHNYFFIVFQRK